MFKLAVGVISAIALVTILGWIGWFSGIANDVHQALYGTALAHPHGNTADHLNDWLTFLPDDPLTRASLACGFIAGAFTLSLVVSVLGVEWAKWQADRTLEQSSRIRTLDSFHRI
jgi:hypothetical protein